MRFQKKRITIDGKLVTYWEKNSAKKEVIVFLHGFPGSHRGLIDMASAFSEYRLIVPDLPACGESEAFDWTHNLENYSKWLNNFLKELKIKKIVLVGHSFGSRIGLYFGGHYRNKIDRLVLVTPVSRVEGLIARLASLNFKVAEYLPLNLQKKWISNPVYRTAGHIIVFKTCSKKRRKILIANDVKEFNHLDSRATIQLFEEFYSSDLSPLGKDIKAKTLVIAGEKDEIAPLSSVIDVVEHLPNAQLVVMKKEGHIVVAESPLTTASIIKEWLKS